MTSDKPFPATRTHHSALAYISALLLTLCGCAPTHRAPDAKAVLVSGSPTAASQVTPSESLAIAEIYSRHAWRPFSRNILHGIDANGVRVDSPDVGYQPKDGRAGWWIPGEVNQGIPYKWGGFDDPDSFDQGIASGQSGGDVSSPAKRLADNAAVSAYAAGVDCSGFVSRCLKLPKVHDTSQLPALCSLLPSAEDLEPGDLLNIPHRHVLLCAGWARPDRSWIYFYETGGVPDWKPALKQAPLSKLLALGYQPLRYSGMARKAGPPGKQIISRTLLSCAIVIEEPTIGEP